MRNTLSIARSLLLTALGGLLLTDSALATFPLVERSHARCVVVSQTGATVPEQRAARELVDALWEVSGGVFRLVTTNASPWGPQIIIGPGPVAQARFPEVALDQLGPEELVMKVKGNCLLLAGGRPRGTLYAVNRFLQEQAGVRWWTPWATNYPRRTTLRIPDLDVRQQPAFEYRAPFWFTGFDPVWKVRNGSNDEHHRIPDDLGGCLRYKGFCHTFYQLVPPAKHFPEHPEWFSLINGQRTHERAQLCLSNPQLRDFVTQRVREWLRDDPGASIISVTQNDCHGNCQCAACKAIDDAEGTPAGSMLSFVNDIAGRIEAEFPHVAVDTFAYQYTRKPPKTIKPRPNVIVRLCSIECNFREPLDHPSNASFLADLEGWSKMCRRLYIWDYTTDFAGYLMPHPNWFTLGPNVRLFQKYGVRGLFEQGAYQDYGAEMAELRAWVLAQLLWNPQQDDRALIREFLEGYYGPAAAKPIGRYLDLMHQASKGFFLGCYTRGNAPHRAFPVLAEAERCWQEAEKAAKGNPELLDRVRLSHQPVRFAFLKEWKRLRRECGQQNARWPLPQSRKEVAGAFAAVAQGVPGKKWTHFQRLNEGGLTVEALVKEMAEDLPEPKGPPPAARKNPRTPSGLSDAAWRRCVDVQENLVSLFKPGECAKIRQDKTASDDRAVWMPCNHREWAYRIKGASLPQPAQRGTWKVYVVARMEGSADGKPESLAFEAGVYDNLAKHALAGLQVPWMDAGSGYRSYLVGTVEMSPERDLWVAPSSGSAAQAVWVDRVYLAPVR